MVKVVSYARGHSVKKMMNYVARVNRKTEEPLQFEDDMGARFRGKDDVTTIYNSWKPYFERSKPGAKRLHRHAVHLMLSGACENIDANARKVLAAAREVIVDQIGDKGYDYIFVQHRDTGHSHVHFVVRCKNRDPKQPKLRLGPAELLEIRTAFAERMAALGLSHVATLRRDRPHIAERVENGIEDIRKRETQYQRAMKRATPSIDAFRHRKAVSSVIVRLRDQVKQETKPKTKERLAMLGALRSLEKKLKRSRYDIDREIAATVNKFGKEAARFKAQIEKLKRPEASPEIKMTAAERERRRKPLKTMSTRTAQAIEVARAAIKESEAPDQEKKDALYMLRQHERAIARALRRGTVDDKEFAPKVVDMLSGIERKASDFDELKRRKPERARRLMQNRALDKLSEEIGKGIDQARKAVKKSKVSPENKKAVLDRLRQHEKAVKRGFVRSR